MSTIPGDVARLLRPDGSVLVPGDVAGELLAAAVRDLTARARRDGLLVSARAQRILLALHEAAERHEQTSTAAGTEPVAPATVAGRVAAAQAAGLLGCTESYVRRLCRAGRLAGERVGPVWLVDTESLDAYRYRRTT
ncbi:helix-turn-helix domain-containing protein [Dactylosporangium sp. CA-152071]|uniref:helix-turn-helix domain-containing protein n=1 Tax=Dactylosporangium sp. CA-152071 TaxID=3239933 RepID=UPI003D8B24C2